MPVRPPSILRHDRRGVAALEFGLTAPVMLLLLFGIYDIGSAIWERMVMEQALRAGAQAAFYFQTQTSNIIATVTGVLPASWQSQFVATATLTGDGAAPQFVTLTLGLAAGASPPLPSILFATLVGTTSTYVVRVQ